MIAMTMKKAIALCVAGLVFGSLLTSCVTSERTYQGAGAGGALGAITGALVDKDNRWRGGIIGAAIGAALGGTVTEIATRASREAAQQNQATAYSSEDGSQRVVSTPVGASPRPGCKRVREQVYQDGVLVRDQMVDICKG